jgi:copper homeostasis protein CutC
MLNEDGTIDVIKLKEIISLVIEKPNSLKYVTFHRAFDMTSNWEISMKDIVNINLAFQNSTFSAPIIQRILTSGMESTCLEGNVKQTKNLTNQTNK